MTQRTSPPAELQELQARQRQRHGELFAARAAEVRAFFAPGRVNLMGAHLDYNGGPVFPTAVDRGTVLTLSPRSDSLLCLRSTLEAPLFEAPLDALPRSRHGSWYDYPLGVVADLLKGRQAPTAAEHARGADVLFGGNLPIGAGLSSSASICVATALAFDQYWQLGLAPMERVHAALRAEREFVGVQCGIMDPFAVGLARPGKLLWLDCKDASYEHVRFPFDRVSIGVIDSGVRRELARGEFNLRVAQSRSAFESLRKYQPAATCLRDIDPTVLERHHAELEPLLERRARHVLSEVARTFAAREALRSNRLVDFGAQMALTHASLRDLYQVSVPELDLITDVANQTPGVYGARLTGAGFGGCAVMVLERGREAEASQAIAQAFEQRFKRIPRIDFFAGDEGPRELLPL